jgi:multicomponent Na+:H+ antiporter subunit F
VTGWELAAAALVPALAIPVLAASRGRTGDRLAAIQLASSVFTILLAVMTFAFDQSSFIDLALAVPLLTLPGTLACTVFLERWL